MIRTIRAHAIETDNLIVPENKNSSSGISQAKLIVSDASLLVSIKGAWKSINLSAA